MLSIPFIGRLFWREYMALVGGLLLVGLEVIVRIITLAMPERLLRWFYQKSRHLFNLLSSPQSRRSRTKNRAVVNPIAHANDFTELCELFGYHTEEHVVQTKDGYLLGVHRLPWKPGEEDKRVNAGPGSIQKKVVYLHHGLMMNSEVWVCLDEKERCLPFTLVEQGYDVWLGNNRGNKYSKKSVHHSPTSTKFWDFSIDQFAFHDIPDTISYVLSTTRQPSLSYIGFSQGTAQAFATLSIHPTLNDKVDVFIALAPAMSPPGLNQSIVSSLVKASPEVLFLAFSRRSMLSSATMWQAILYPPLFVRFIDMSLSFLFGWHTSNITAHQKLAAYPHLYSFAATKCVVHWFQIIRNGAFQMYDDEVQRPLSFSEGRRYYKVAKFPTRNIKTPIVLVYGGSDSLVDINVMLKELPRHTVATEIPHYEHLDFLWAMDVNKQVFPHVFEALEFHARPVIKKDGPSPWRTTRVSSSSTQPPSYSDDEGKKHHNGAALPPTSSPNNNLSGADGSSPTNFRRTRDSSQTSHKSKVSQSRYRPRLESPAPSNISVPVSETPSRPEGWWSSDDAGDGAAALPPQVEQSIEQPVSRKEKGSRRDQSKKTKQLDSRTDEGAVRRNSNLEYDHDSHALRI